MLPRWCDARTAKDCIHYDIGGSCIICGFQSRKPDDFCSYGERKNVK